MISEVIGDEHKRREFIKWIFLFIRSVTAEASGQKYIDAETALDLWTALESFCQQYKLTKKLYPHLDGFRQFIDVKSGSIRTINLDQWMMFLDFNKNILIDCSNYGDDSALPAMFDEYVQWCRDNGINGASHSLKPAPIAQEEMYNFDRMDEY
ncbi:hypothetical protein GQ42DRAFT_125399 [Ramicandelaber brevisporus]|nr:hypothetical protein GQ42DRAFT_125399 [Ramicandelaber brevisporus]